MKEVGSNCPDESKIEAFRVSVEKLLDEGSNIAKELTLSEEFRTCVTRQEETKDEDEGCCLELLEDFEQFSLTNGIKLNSNLDSVGLSFVQEVCPDGIKVCGSFMNGMPHGFFRILNRYGDLLFFGCFIHGRLHGQTWKSLLGGGFLLNPTKDNFDFTGKNVTYFYPDCQTVFVGNFEQGSMLSARASEILTTESNCCGLEMPIFGPFEEHAYRLDISTESRISTNPLWRDPYECFFVYVSESQISGAGEGLFAKIDVDRGTVLAFYNGTRKPACLATEDSVENTPYKISLNKHTDMDIPSEFASLDTYNSSLAHKKISAGEELTVDYKYDLNIAPAWYKKTWARHQKKLRGMPNWQTALSQKKRYLRKSSTFRSYQLSS